MKNVFYIIFTFFFVSQISGQIDTLIFSSNIDTSFCAEGILLHTDFDTSEYNFQWSNGDTTPFIKVEMPNDSISLKYIDSCLIIKKPDYTDSIFLDVKMLLKRPAKANFLLIPETACNETPLQFENRNPVSSSSLHVFLNDSLVLDTTADIQLAQFDSLSIGEYDFRFIVNSESGCSDTMKTSVNITKSPIVNFFTFNSNSIFCQSEDIVFKNRSAVYDDNTTLIVINQHNNDTVITKPNFIDSTLVLNNIIEGEQTLKFVLINSNGCTDSQSITVKVIPSPHVEILTQLQKKYCVDNEPIKLEGNYNGGEFYASDSLLISYGADGNYYFTPWEVRNNYSIIYSYTDSLSGCSNSDTFTIDWIYPTPSTKFEIDTTCAYDDLIFINQTKGGYPGLSSLEIWEDGVLLHDTFPALDLTFTVGKLPPDDYNYEFVITNAGMCSDTFLLPFTIYPIPEVSFELPKDTFCLNEDSILIQGIVDGLEADTGEFLGNYIKDNKNGTAYFEPTSVDSNFYIYYRYESGYGCMAKDSQYIKHIYPLPKIDFEGVDNNDEFCLYEDAIELTSLYNEGTFNALDILEEINNDVYLNPIDTGIFFISISYEDIHGCSNSITKEIIIHPLPYLNLPQDTFFSPGESVEIGPEKSVNTEYKWSNGKETPKIIVSNPGIYSVTATNTITSCMNADTITVSFEVPSRVQNIDQLKVKLFPNPVNDFLYIKSEDYSGEIKVIDTRGVLYYDDKINSGQTINISSNSWAPGIYFIVFSDHGSIKVIKQ